MLLLIRLAALLEGLSLTLIQGFLPLYVRRTLGEPSFVTLGALVAVPALGTILASNFWGGLSDVSGRLKPFILVGLLGYAAVLAGLPLMNGGLLVLAYVGALSLFFGAHAPLLKTYVTLARPRGRENALAYLLMFQSIGWLTGSVGGSRLLEGGLGPGFKAALWACAGLAATHAVILTVWLRDLRHRPAVPVATLPDAPAAAAPAGAASAPGLAPPRAKRGWLAGLVADLSSLYENPRLLGLCVVAFFVVAGNYVMWGFFSVFYTEHLKASVRMLGLALGLSSVSGIVSFFFVGPLVRKLGGALVLAIGTTLYLGMYLGAGLSHDPVVVAIFFALPLYGLVNVATNTLASEYSRTEQRGGGLGILNGTYALSTIVGPLTAGFLADRLRLGIIPWTSFGFVAVASAIAWRSFAVGRAGAVRGRNAD